MSFVLFLALVQSAGGTPPPRADECRSSDGEIVVCGSRRANERYRLRPLPKQYESRPKKAEIMLGEGMSMAAGVEAGGVPGAEDVPRVMVKLRLKF